MHLIRAQMKSGIIYFVVWGVGDDQLINTIFGH
jgi:hypothetical protein